MVGRNEFDSSIVSGWLTGLLLDLEFAAGQVYHLIMN